MKQQNFLILFLLIGLITSGFFHYWEFKRIREFSATFQTQSEIETKRTSLLVIYQEVLRNVVRELDELKQNRKNRVSMPITELPVEQRDVVLFPMTGSDFRLPDIIE